MREIKLTNEELGALCTGLAHLYHAGIGGGDALALLSRDERDSRVRLLLDDMSRRADEGAFLGDIFAEQGCFPGYLCHLLKVADRVGRTEQVLEELGEHYSGRARMDARLRAALLYPLVMLAVMLAVVAVLLIWVLPVFNDVYAQLGSRLTGLAGGLLTLGQALRAALPILCAVAGLLLVLVMLCVLCPGVGRAISGFWRERGAHRGVHGRINAARFAQGVAMGLAGGMNQQEAVELALELTRDCGRFADRGRDCLERVEQGAALGDALRDCGMITAAQARVLEAGIRAGRGEQVMEQIASRDLEQGELELERAVTRVEPMLVVVTCVMVGIILLSVMLPLMHIMNGIG